MRMILQQNGAYTRTWVGGLRYLKTGRFIWLDGSQWSYADWLSGEPNNTSDVEDCVEVLAHGNGKFNDFTCWEPQAFMCCYPYW
ncbi:lectin-like [Chaetodon trifascialis]|uniref:lectin-like n=1 Tax=Chaetodon trifascialis TaxID=109706 RepID=UPI0039932D10